MGMLSFVICSFSKHLSKAHCISGAVLGSIQRWAGAKPSQLSHGVFHAKGSGQTLPGHLVQLELLDTGHQASSSLSILHPVECVSGPAQSSYSPIWLVPGVQTLTFWGCHCLWYECEDDAWRDDWGTGRYIILAQVLKSLSINVSSLGEWNASFLHLEILDTWFFGKGSWGYGFSQGRDWSCFLQLMDRPSRMNHDWILDKREEKEALNDILRINWGIFHLTVNSCCLIHCPLTFWQQTRWRRMKSVLGPELCSSSLPSICMLKP